MIKIEVIVLVNLIQKCLIIATVKILNKVTENNITQVLLVVYLRFGMLISRKSKKVVAYSSWDLNLLNH